MLKRTGVVVFAVVAFACSGGSTPSTPSASPAAAPSSGASPTQVVFTASSQLSGVNAGTPLLYSFCKPDIGVNDLCQNSTNPSGGQPPYHFQLGSGTGFPPLGVTLNQNGTLTGTPTAAGSSTFSVCAVDLAGRSACQTVTMIVAGAVTVGRLTYSCSTSASPLPGWRNCTGTVALTITKTISSGIVSVFFNYGSSGSFYHGQVAVTPGVTSYTVNVVNEYVSTCLTSYTTSVDVYDGAQSASNPPLLVSTPVTLTGTCS